VKEGEGFNLFLLILVVIVIIGIVGMVRDLPAFCEVTGGHLVEVSGLSECFRV
jgi:hypothetical protein